jgi:hypothetical protein
MTNRWSYGSMGAIVGLATTIGLGCSTQTGPAEEPGTGTVQFPLVTATKSAYRLRSAQFAVTTQNASPIVTLDSESDPDAAALTTTLAQGPYLVRLMNGWTLFRINDDTTQTQVRGALISPNPQSFEIKKAMESDVTFTFTTEDGIVNIGSGPLSITFDVSANTGLPSCDLRGFFSGCPSGQSCLLADVSGRTFCASTGALPPGSPCTSEQCQAGAQCLKLDPDHPDQGTCTSFCDTSNTTFGCNCQSLGIANSSAGICGPLPPAACDLLAQTGCADGQACQFLGGSFGTCGMPGTTPARASCAGETCMAGFDCFQGRCLQFCDERVNTPGCVCVGVGTGFIGRCF